MRSGERIKELNLICTPIGIKRGGRDFVGEDSIPGPFVHPCALARMEKNESWNHRKTDHAYYRTVHLRFYSPLVLLMELFVEAVKR